MKEFDLYEPMRLWLQQYLKDKYPSRQIITVDAHSERLDRVLRKFGIVCEVATGIDIKIDVLGIVRSNEEIMLFFVEAKKNDLTLRDLGQLWAYCKLIDPQEAFLLSSADLGGLHKILKAFNREDLLDFGDGRRIKKMQVGCWNFRSQSPDFNTMIPKID